MKKVKKSTCNILEGFAIICTRKKERLFLKPETRSFKMSLKSEIFSMINTFPIEFRKDEMVRTFIGGFDGLVKDEILQLIGITISNRFNTYVQWRGAGYGFCVVSDNHVVMKLLDDLLQHIKSKKRKSLK